MSSCQIITNFAKNKYVYQLRPIADACVRSFASSASAGDARADHPNLAAGSLALFLEWKKAGGNAEQRVYGDGRGPYVLMEDARETTELWSRQFVLWLQAKGFVDK